MKETKTKSEETPTYEVNRFTFAVDYIKHLTTLATGSIVLLAGFITKQGLTANSRTAFTISLIGFGATVVFSTIIYSVAILQYRPEMRQLHSHLIA